MAALHLGPLLLLHELGELQLHADGVVLHAGIDHAPPVPPMSGSDPRPRAYPGAVVPRLRLQRRRSRDEVVAALAHLATTRFAGRGLAVQDDAGEPVVLAWTAGPSPSAVADAVGEVLGDLAGWEVQLVLPGQATPPATGPQHLVLRRDLDDAALAVAVVRFQGSRGRPFRSDAERDRAPMHDLLDVDDPARSGYPVVDAMAALLLAEPEPAGEPPRPLPAPLDRMSWRLEAAGYDRLWATAWAGVA